MPTLNTTAQLLSHWCAQQQQTLFSTPCQILAYPLRVEASHREFYRLQDALSDRSWIAMSSPPTLENNEQFVALAKLFHGLGTPKLLAADQVNGFSSWRIWAQSIYPMLICGLAPTRPRSRTFSILHSMRLSLCSSLLTLRYPPTQKLGSSWNLTSAPSGLRGA